MKRKILCATFTLRREAQYWCEMAREKADVSLTTWQSLRRDSNENILLQKLLRSSTIGVSQSEARANDHDKGDQKV